MIDLFKTRTGRYLLSLRARIFLLVYLMLYIPMCFVTNFLLAMYTQYYVRLSLNRQLPPLGEAFPIHIKDFFTVSSFPLWWFVLLVALAITIWRSPRIISRLEKPFFAAWIKKDKEAVNGTNASSVYREYHAGDAVHYADAAGNQITGTVGFGEYKHQSGKTISIHNGFYVLNVAVSTTNGSYLLYKDLVEKKEKNPSEWACVQERRLIVSVGEYTLRQS